MRDASRTPLFDLAGNHWEMHGEEPVPHYRRYEADGQISELLEVHTQRNRTIGGPPLVVLSINAGAAPFTFAFRMQIEHARTLAQTLLTAALRADEVNQACNAQGGRA
jgi:hypothetical protein